ncbi:DUF7079 family protein [Rhizobium mongolense]|uniref:DUF7079 family protein n=1 Tax=Rhizobium mongolense TaxID=57676 RepID=UPI003CC92213
MLREAPVWHALSNWFLDTELQAEDCRQTAEVPAISGYSSVEPPSILENEVALRSLPTSWAAGEWAGWSEIDVRRSFSIRRAGKTGEASHLFGPSFKGLR